MLEARGLEKAFGGHVALDGVDLDVAPREVVGLVGPNGAGKTTVLRCVSGEVRPDAGTLTFERRDLSGLAVWRRARLGIGRTYQRVEVFGELTVRDHLLVALEARRRPLGGRLWRDLVGMSAPGRDERVALDALLDALGLLDRAEVPVAALGLGTCRLVELARAVVAGPRLLLADEPSSGLDQEETAELARVLRDLGASREMAVLLVEHDLAMVEAVAHRVVVMDLGRVVASGSFAEVMGAPEVRRAYLGVP